MPPPNVTMPLLSVTTPTPTTTPTPSPAAPLDQSHLTPLRLRPRRSPRCKRRHCDHRCLEHWRHLTIWGILVLLLDNFMHLLVAVWVLVFIVLPWPLGLDTWPIGAGFWESLGGVIYLDFSLCNRLIKAVDICLSVYETICRGANDTALSFHIWLTAAPSIKIDQ
jgi:hypothetical protein